MLFWEGLGGEKCCDDETSIFYKYTQFLFLFFKACFMMQRMRKLLNSPWDLMGLRCVNTAPIGSHFLFYDGKKTDWLALCRCRMSEDTLIHWHTDRGFTDLFLGADTWDLIETDGWINWLLSFPRDFLPPKITAWAFLQSSACLPAQVVASVWQTVVLVDFEPTLNEAKWHF